VLLAQFDDAGEPLGVVEQPTFVKNDAGWRRVLTPAQFEVLRRGATELPNPAADRETFQAGLYRCAGCGAALFASRDRFASGSGWPAFAKPIAPQNVESRWDESWGVHRRQVVCRLCGGALGHVFKDGPAPTYLRYCINPSALQFRAVR
jgi:peptide-methionine (R)-S-oxide reductase